MLLINIHHYIMGLAGAPERGRGTRAAAAAARGSRGGSRTRPAAGVGGGGF